MTASSDQLYSFVDSRTCPFGFRRCWDCFCGSLLFLPLSARGRGGSSLGTTITASPPARLFEAPAPAHQRGIVSSAERYLDFGWMLLVFLVCVSRVPFSSFFQDHHVPPPHHHHPERILHSEFVDIPRWSLPARRLDYFAFFFVCLFLFVFVLLLFFYRSPNKRLVLIF